MVSKKALLTAAAAAAIAILGGRLLAEEKTPSPERPQDAPFPSALADYKLAALLKQPKYQKAMAGHELTVTGMLDFASVSGKEAVFKFKTSGMELRFKTDDKAAAEVLDFVKTAKEGEMSNSYIYESWLAKLTVKGKLPKSVSMGKTTLDDAEIVAWYGVEVLQLTWDEDGNLAKSAKKLASARKLSDKMSDLDSPAPPDLKDDSNSGKLSFSIVAGHGMKPSIVYARADEGAEEKASGPLTRIFDKDGAPKVEIKMDKGHLASLDFDSDPLCLASELQEIWKIAKNRKCGSFIDLEASASGTQAAKELSGASILSWKSSKEDKLSIYPVQNWIKESVPLKQAALQR